MPYNLDSPNGLLEPFDSSDMAGWYKRETLQVKDENIRHVLNFVVQYLNDFVQWPVSATLLWNGCDRIAPTGFKMKYHRYPESIRAIAKSRSVYLDARPNGPAIAAYLLAGGIRPSRFGSANAWSVHHLYSGKFPYFERSKTTHAIKECKHFTQSAGLIAVHPVADALVDEYPFFTWYLRALAFQKFGYDPDAVFSVVQDDYGFKEGTHCELGFNGAPE